MHVHHHVTAADIAVFPLCPDCGHRRVPPVPDAPVCVQVGNETIVNIPRSQEAAVIRFMAQTDKPVLWDHLYQAIGSQEVSRCLARLRQKWGIPILCARIPKDAKPGIKGAYYLAPDVKILEQGKEIGGSNAR